MKGDKTQVAIGAALLAFAGIWRWHNPKAKKLTPQEIDSYLDIIAKLPLPDHHIDDILPRLRTWAEADDGKPVSDVYAWRGSPGAWREDVVQVRSVYLHTPDGELGKKLRRLGNDAVVAGLSLAGGTSLEVATNCEHRVALLGPFDNDGQEGPVGRDDDCIRTIR